MLQINQQTMSSREIAKLCNSSHDNVLKTVRRLIELGIVLKTTPSKYTNEQNHQTYTEYLSDKRDSLIIVARLSPEFTAVVVDRWQELEAQQQPKLPTDYLSALEHLVVAVKENTRLESINNKLMHVNKTYTSSELAKELGLTSAIALNVLLNEKGVQYKQNETWLPYARYSTLGYFEIKQSDYNGHIKYDRRFTQKGRQFVLDLVGDKNA